MIRIILDLDGVVSNFCKAAYEITGHGEDYVFGKVPTTYNWFVEEWGMTEKDFWSRVNSRGINFFANLELYPWAGELINLVESYDPEFRVATTPPLNPIHCAGKALQIQKAFGEHFRRGHITALKEDLANPWSILIDDSESNCEKFVEAGGSAVLFPNSENKNKEMSCDPMPYVVQRLKNFASIRKGVPANYYPSIGNQDAHDQKIAQILEESDAREFYDTGCCLDDTRKLNEDAQEDIASSHMGYMNYRDALSSGPPEDNLVVKAVKQMRSEGKTGTLIDAYERGLVKTFEYFC